MPLRFWPFLVAVAAVSLAALIRGPLLSPFLSDRVPLGVFTLAVIVSAWYGGLWPGLLATVLSVAVSRLYFLLPFLSVGVSGYVGVTIFVVNCVLISVVCESFHRSRRRLLAGRKEIEESERRFRESEERHRAILDAVPHIVWKADAGGTLAYANAQWTKRLNVPIDSLNASHCSDAVHEEDLPTLAETWRHAMQTSEPCASECRVKMADGSWRWHLVHFHPSKNPAGKVTEWFGTATDIHERKEAEEARNSLLKIEQAARTEAERAAQLKDEFLSIVSHEMRTPLTAMLGWVQLLRQGGLPQEAVPQALETIERNARAQAKLIDDLLDMSRILSGRLRLEPQQVCAAEIIEAAIAAIEPAAAAKGISLGCHLEPHTSMVSADSTRLQQVIGNLLSNAVKFTQPGGKVEVALRQRDAEIEIAVTDTGEGIHPDFLPHVFERFRQQDATTSRRHQGLGLGLSIARQLVELHGGGIRAESRGEGQGSRFIVSLPALSRRRSGTANNGALAFPGKVQAAASSLLGLKVLVVDDDADARELLRSILAQRGASVRTAGSTPDGLKSFEERRPDVLVSDIGMPLADGYELIRHIRSRDREHGGDVPALALTAFARNDDSRKAISAGFHMHLAKPIEPADLVSAVAALAMKS